MVFSYGMCITGFYYEIIHCEVGTLKSYNVETLMSLHSETMFLYSKLSSFL